MRTVTVTALICSPLKTGIIIWNNNWSSLGKVSLAYMKYSSLKLTTMTSHTLMLKMNTDDNEDGNDEREKLD